MCRSFSSIAAIAACSVVSAFAGIVLPAPALDRDRVVTVLYRTNSLATGHGTLHVQWTDVLGRLVQDSQLPVELIDENEVSFPLDLRRAVSMKNTLSVTFELGQRREQSQVDFIASPPEREWTDYHIIMWQQYPQNLWPALKALGIDAGEYSGKSEPPADFLLPNGLRWYAENLATDFYSEYHRFFPDRPVNWKFHAAKDLYKQDPSSKEAFKRHPSLSDAAWLEKIHDRLVTAAQKHSPYRPLFYDLGDESGVADLAAPWDFDFSDESLVGMRIWLKERYPTLAALNRQWGTSFTSWDVVTPQTTREAMRRTDANFSAWSDHKEWMDVVYARALRMGADAIHSVDPTAYVGIAGAQMPGWGGYDYARLSGALNFFEPYDIGNNIEILRSLAPRTPVVTTSFAHGPHEKQRVWYELLHGGRGLILWDDKREFVNADGTPGARGLEAAPYFQEIRAGIGALLIASERVADPIAIHYSQASFRADWMLRNQPYGDAWMDRKASTERKDNDFLRMRESYCRLLEDLGLQYQFVSYDQLNQGELARGAYRVLVLPDSIALSEAEAAAIRAFVQSGGTVITSGEPGAFDEHSRKRPEPSLQDVRAKMIEIPGDVLNYHQHRLVKTEGPVLEAARQVFMDAGVRPRYAVLDDQGHAVVGVETHVFHNGGATIIGLLTNPQLRVDELGPPEFQSNERFEKPYPLRLILPNEANVYDIRKGRYLGKRRQVELTLDPFEPALYALLPGAAGELHLSSAPAASLGQTTQVSWFQDSAADTGVVHVEVVDPEGHVVEHYSGNFSGHAGRGGMQIPFAANDRPGRWEVRARDVLTGGTARITIETR